MPLGDAEGRRELKQQLLAELSRVHRALAAPARIELLELLAYCRGVMGLLAMEAVGRLRKAGFTARRLALGFPEWRAAGLPLAALPI